MIISPTFREMLGQASGPAGGPASTDAGGYEIISPGALGADWANFSHARAGPYLNNVTQVSNIVVGKDSPLRVSISVSTGTNYIKISTDSFDTGNYGILAPGWNTFTNNALIGIPQNAYVGFTHINTGKAGAVVYTITDSFGNTVDTFTITIT